MSADRTKEDRLRMNRTAWDEGHRYLAAKRKSNPGRLDELCQGRIDFTGVELELLGEDLAVCCHNWQRVLRSGGRLFLHEGHPVTRCLREEGDGESLKVTKAYGDRTPEYSMFRISDFVSETNDEVVQRYASDEFVARTTTIPHPYPEDGAITYVRQCLEDQESGAGYTFAILADGEVVGTLGIGAVDRERGTGQCDYAISSTHWNRGIVTQAVAAALRFAFVDLGLETVRSACLQRNPASGRVLEKNRFTETRQFIYTHAKFEGEPARQFEIHKRDWLTVTSDAQPLGVMGGTVVLREHTLLWLRLFEDERDAILRHVHGIAVAVEHIGSTAVPGLVAKPILDIAVVVADAGAVRTVAERLSAAGYLDRGDKGDNGGYLLVRETAPRVRAIHVHIVEESDPQLGHWIAFRDLLRRDPEVRERYADLKLSLAAEYGLNRQAYTAGKEALIKTLTDSALPSDR